MPTREGGILTLDQFCLKYGVSQIRANQLIKRGVLKAFKIPIAAPDGTPTTAVAKHTYRIQDPLWTRDLHGKKENPEDLYLLRGCEVCDILGMTPRAVRYLCQSRKLKFLWICKKRRYCIADVRDFMRLRASGKHRKYGKSRPLMVDWAKRHLGISSTPEKVN